MASVAVSCPAASGYAPSRRRAPARRRAPSRRRVTRRRLTGRRRALGSRLTRGANIHSPTLSKFILANLQPFNQNCDGVKVPDANTYPSTPVKMEDEINHITDATFGVATRAYRPYPTATVVTATAASASSWTWSAAYGGTGNSARRAQIANNYSLVRPAAHGIRISAPTASTTTTGFLHVCIYAPNFAGTTWAFPTSISEMNNCMNYVRYPLSALTQRHVTVVNKFLDASAARYVDPSSDIAVQQTDLSFQTEGWGTIIVAVEAAPVSTTAISVEVISHLECTPLFSGINSSTPAAPYNVADMEKVSRAAGHTMASTIQGEEEPALKDAFAAMAAAGSRARGAYQSIPRPVRNWAWNSARQGLSSLGWGIPGVTDFNRQSGFSQIGY